MNTTSRFYRHHAQRFGEHDDTLYFEIVHQFWKGYWPLKGDSVLGIGTVFARDAKWMNQQDTDVIALMALSSRKITNKLLSNYASIFGSTIKALRAAGLCFSLSALFVTLRTSL